MRLSSLNHPRTWRFLLAGYWLTLFVLTHLPRVGPLSVAAKHDKLAHAAAYAVLAALLATAWQIGAGLLSVSQLAWAWLALLVYAGLDEWTQSFVGRHASAWDWMADAIGAFLGLALFAWLGPRMASGRGQ
jgi:VanZ family protein